MSTNKENLVSQSREQGIKKIRGYVVVVGAAAAALTFVGCNRQAKLETDQDRGSYVVGLQIGKSLKTQNADVTLPALMAGLSDGLDGKDSKLKPEEMQAALNKMQESAVKKAQEQANQNAKVGDEWLAKNKEKSGVKTTASGLQYEVVKEGAGKTPADTDTVKVHYTGTLISGEKFDSSRDRGAPVEFPVNGVIPGWTEALKLMKEGSQYKLAIPANLAYGPQGRPGIPPNSTLLFDVELLEVKGGQANPMANAVQSATAQPMTDHKGKKKQ